LIENQVDQAFVCPKNGTLSLNYVLALTLCTFKPAIFVHFVAARNTFDRTA